jgi:hypothetical protein
MSPMSGIDVTQNAAYDRNHSLGSCNREPQEGIGVNMWSFQYTGCVALSTVSLGLFYSGPLSPTTVLSFILDADLMCLLDLKLT